MNRNVYFFLQKTQIWEWCCKEEIPKNQLIEYLQSYQEDDRDKWLHIYINWYSWESIDQVMCDIVLSPVEVPRISCIAVSGNYIAVGSQDGRLRIFSNEWKLLYAARILAVKISSLTFMESKFVAYYHTINSTIINIDMRHFLFYRSVFPYMIIKKYYSNC